MTVTATMSGVGAMASNLEERKMRIAIPIEGGRLCPHFGHCEVFAFVDVDEAAKTVTGRQDLAPPPHEPGVLPGWVAARGAHVVLAGGMGGRAVSLFEQAGVRVLIGCPAESPEELVKCLLEGKLVSGGGVCGGGGHTCGE